MDQIWKELRQLFTSLAQRLTQLLSDSPRGALQLTGVLGLAAVLYGLYQIRGAGRRKSSPRNEQGQRDTSDDGASSSGLHASRSQASLRKRHQSFEPTAHEVRQPQTAAPGERSLASAVRSRLGGSLRTLTISAPGVLLEEWTAAELQEAATLREEAAEVLREIAQVASVYVITQVEDDTGEATCRGALEAGGLVGTRLGQIPPHRLLFCSTLDGKVSIVRQLEPQLHVDGHPKTIEDLKRFIKLVHICPPGSPPAGVRSANVGSAHSLVHLFSS